MRFFFKPLLCDVGLIKIETLFLRQLFMSRKWTIKLNEIVASAVALQKLLHVHQPAPLEGDTK